MASSFSRSRRAQNGRAAAGRYRNHQRRTVNDRRHDKAGFLRGIHHVTEDAARFTGVADALIHFIVIRGGKVSQQVSSRDSLNPPFTSVSSHFFSQASNCRAKGGVNGESGSCF